MSPEETKKMIVAALRPGKSDAQRIAELEQLLSAAVGIIETPCSLAFRRAFIEDVKLALRR